MTVHLSVRYFSYTCRIQISLQMSKQDTKMGNNRNYISVRELNNWIIFGINLIDKFGNIYQSLKQFLHYSMVFKSKFWIKIKFFWYTMNLLLTSFSRQLESFTKWFDTIITANASTTRISEYSKWTKLPVLISSLRSFDVPQRCSRCWIAFAIVSERVNVMKSISIEKRNFFQWRFDETWRYPAWCETKNIGKYVNAAVCGLN